MSSEGEIVFSVMYALESLIMTVGNAFTIYVFWTRRLSLKRTGFLLINLAVADLLVGVSTVVEIIQKSDHYEGVYSVFQYVSSCASVFSLVAISLERVYAILWPLRHRTASTCAYIVSIALTWIGGLIVAMIFILTRLEILPRVYDTVVSDITLVSALVIFVGSYMTIRNRMKHTAPALHTHNRNSMEQNAKLSRTLFLMIALSLLFWLPAIVLYTVHDICNRCVPELLLSISRALHLANSIINPVVYSYRMPMFKEAMEKCLNKCGFFKKQRNDEMPQSDTFDTAL